MGNYPKLKMSHNLSSLCKSHKKPPRADDFRPGTHHFTELGWHLWNTTGDFRIQVNETGIYVSPRGFAGCMFNHAVAMIIDDSDIMTVLNRARSLSIEIVMPRIGGCSMAAYYADRLGHLIELGKIVGLQYLTAVHLEVHVLSERTLEGDLEFHSLQEMIPVVLGLGNEARKCNPIITYEGPIYLPEYSVAPLWVLDGANDVVMVDRDGR